MSGSSGIVTGRVSSRAEAPIEVRVGERHLGDGTITSHLLAQLGGIADENDGDFIRRRECSVDDRPHLRERYILQLRAVVVDVSGAEAIQLDLAQGYCPIHRGLEVERILAQ